MTDAPRRTDALYRALARSFPNAAVILVDRALRCVLAEGRGLGGLGIARDAAEGRPIAAVFPAELGLRFEAGCRAAFSEQVTAGEIAMGERVHLVHWGPLHDPGGGVEAAMIATQDITLQKSAEEELRRAAGLRELFIGVLAHDLRSPLQAISLAAARLARASAPAVSGSAARIEDAAARMSRMVRDLLDLSLIRQGGGIPVVPAPADLAAVSARVLDEIREVHAARRIVLATDGDASGAWDADRLAQVVSNLVGNAVLYSPPETTVTVRVRCDGPACALAVHNEGAPIPAEAIPTLFDPFRRGTAPRAAPGLGLGLYIADRIVTAHGGAISVTSSAAEGTTFTVTLPRSPPAAAQDERAAGPEASAPSPAECARTVLVVEDDADIREALRESLEAAGYGVLTAANGREAMDVLDRRPPPCVMLLDLMMPVMNGWEVLATLRADRELSKLPVVVVSAAQPLDEPLPGTRRVLPKPVCIDRLLDAVEESCPPPEPAGGRHAA